MRRPLRDLLEFRRDRIGLLERVFAEDPELGRFWLGPREIWVVSAAELAREVLLDQADAFQKGPTVRVHARPLLGDGIIPSSGEAHLKKRKVLAAAFHPRRVERYAEGMAAEVDRLIAELPSGPVDLAPWFERLALRIVGRTLLSADLTGDAREIGGAFRAILEHVSARIEEPLALPLFVPTARHRRVRAAFATFDRLLYRLIAERRAGGERGDVLDVLIAEGLTSVEIRDELANLLVAGYETTASALAFTVGALLAVPEAKARAEAEARAGVGEGPSFLAAAQAEALRLYPPVHTLGREAARELTLGGRRCPKGTIVIVSAYLLHRRPDVFPAPREFRPERFFAEVPRYAYLPFGAGPRVCLGQHFASLELSIALRALFARLELEPVRPGLPAAEMFVTLRPRGGMPAVVRRL